MEHFVFKEYYYLLYQEILKENPTLANNFLIDLITFFYEEKHLSCSNGFIRALVESIDLKELDDDDIKELNEY